MTGAELVHAVRLAFIEFERIDELWRRIPARERRAEYLAASRRNRARRGVLLKSPAFLNVAIGYAAARDKDVFALQDLVTWLGMINLFPEWEPNPRAWVARQRVQEELRRQHAQRLREIASTLRPKYATRLRKVADEIEKDHLAVLHLPDGTSLEKCGADVFAHNLDFRHLGTRGAAHANGGAWRGWLIRELHARLPYLEETPEPYATMAALLTWAGVPQVTPQLVRSVLARGHT